MKSVCVNNAFIAVASPVVEKWMLLFMQMSCEIMNVKTHLSEMGSAYWDGGKVGKDGGEEMVCSQWDGGGGGGAVKGRDYRKTCLQQECIPAGLIFLMCCYSWSSWVCSKCRCFYLSFVVVCFVLLFFGGPFKEYEILGRGGGRI